MGAALQTLKVREAALVLLQVHPSLREVLFDFSAPGKLDLAAFMEQHFRAKASLPQLAYLTGRSLETFRRDFSKLFRKSPAYWLRQRRLQKAYWLLTVAEKTPSTVYLKVGFENFSYFSFTFKQTYGCAPSRAVKLEPAASSSPTSSCSLDF